MKQNSREEGLRWLEQAGRDLDDARYAAEGKRFHLGCFLAQQSAEKALKAFLYSSGQEAVWGHSVAELCGDAAGLDPDFNELASKAGPLDKYYIPTRYPNGLPGGIPSDAFTREDFRSAEAMCDRVISVVKGKLGVAE
jgi:HEPN domain-containing protein